MRIDRCKGCGEYIDIASDHKPNCTRNNQVIPAQAIEAAALVMELALYGDNTSPDDIDLRTARLILEAAAPYMLSHEREQTRLAHLDAMVNRETKQAELAAAWGEGHGAGWNDCLLDLENNGAKTSPNPYRSTP